MKSFASLTLVLALSACSPTTVTPIETTTPVGASAPTTVSSMAVSSTTVPPTTAPPTTTSTLAPTTTTTLPPGVTPPPDWLGTRPLPLDENGDPVALPTPPELSDRRFTTPDHLPAPLDEAFHSTVEPIPADVLARSTWVEGCPTALEDLSYLTVTFRGFDGLAHTGELIVAASVADDIVSVFETMFEAGFPVEEMRITPPEFLDADPTGDGNDTESFVCRPATGGSNWSQHAFGLAIDINPFHNPYLRGDVLIPELAGDYLARDRGLPGMIVEGDIVTDAFDAIGWGWGGRWNSLKDWQHFSQSGT